MKTQKHVNTGIMATLAIIWFCLASLFCGCVPTYTTYFHALDANIQTPKEDNPWLIVGYPVYALRINGAALPPKILARANRTADVLELEPGQAKILFSYMGHSQSSKGAIELSANFEPGMLYVARYWKSGNKWKPIVKKLGPKKLTTLDGKKTIRLEKYREAGQDRFRYVVDDGASKKHYNQFMGKEHYPTYSPDFKRIVFFSIEGPKLRKFVIDGIERSTSMTWPMSGNYVNARVAKFSPDSRKIYYMHFGQKRKDRVMVMDKDTIPITGAIVTNSFVLSKNGEGHAFEEMTYKMKYRICHNGKFSKEYSYENPARAALSHDGKHCAYAEKSGKNQWVVNLDGKPAGPAFDGIKNLKFSETGALNYQAKDKGKWAFVTIGSKE